MNNNLLIIIKRGGKCGMGKRKEVLAARISQKMSNFAADLFNSHKVKLY